MVLIMMTTWIPPHKGPEIAKKFIEVMQKMPYKPFEKQVVFGTRSVKDGMKVIQIVEVEKGKYEEALNITYRRELEFHSIEGYRTEIETLLTLEEALPMVGLKMPTM